MGTMHKGFARFALLVIVSGALSCDGRPPLQSDPTPGPVPSSESPTMSRADAGTDAGAAAGADAAPEVSSAAFVQEVMRRWNLVVDSGSWSIDFHWTQVDQFPHPTFKFGTAQAYGEFASVLFAFFQRDDNFDFLAKNHLFTMELRADTASGQGDVVTTFEKLADYFSSSTAFGDITPEVRAGLAQFDAQIHAAGP